MISNSHNEQSFGFYSVWCCCFSWLSLPLTHINNRKEWLNRDLALNIYSSKWLFYFNVILVYTTLAHATHFIIIIVNIINIIVVVVVVVVDIFPSFFYLLLYSMRLYCSLYRASIDKPLSNVNLTVNESNAKFYDRGTHAHTHTPTHTTYNY